jgi:replicative DNA helicase
MGLFDSDDQVNQWAADATDISAVLPTGFSAIDRYLKRGGLRKGQAMAVAARSEVGKTWMMVNMAVRMVRAGYSVVLSSQEMTIAEVTNRILCVAYGLPVQLVEEKYATDRMYKEWLDKYRRDFGKLTIYDNPEASFDDLHQALTDHERKTGIPADGLLQDYSDLMSVGKLYGGQSSYAPAIAKAFARLAKDRHIAVVSLVQTNRANEGAPERRDHGHRIVTKEALMFGGEQSWSVIAGIWRPELDPDAHDEDLKFGSDRDKERRNRAIDKVEKWKNKAVINVCKNRTGKANVAGHAVGLDWTTGTWNDLAPEEVPAE